MSSLDLFFLLNKRIVCCIDNVEIQIEIWKGWCTAADTDSKQKNGEMRDTEKWVYALTEGLRSTLLSVSAVHQPFYISICFLLLFFFITIIMVMQTIKVHMTWKFTPSFLWLYFQERLKQWRMAFTALSFVVPFLRYYILYNLRYDVTCCTWYCMKIRHIFGFISLNSLKLCRLGQSTKLNSILVFRYGCQDNRLVSRPLLSKHEFFQIWTFQVFLFCFILSCGIVK